MACWYPSDSQEAWFPQLRVNRLAKEAEEKEPVCPMPEPVCPMPTPKARKRAVAK